MKIGDVIKWWVLGCLLIVLAGCGSEEAETAVVEVAMQEPEAMMAVDADLSVLDLWSHSCALCHVDGNGGAPRMGNKSEWTPRLAKGADVLLQHTLDGFNQMPPLGYCMACERRDFVEMIDFMTQNMSAEQSPGVTQ